MKPSSLTGIWGGFLHREIQTLFCCSYCRVCLFAVYLFRVLLLMSPRQAHISSRAPFFWGPLSQSKHPILNYGSAAFLPVFFLPINLHLHPPLSSLSARLSSSLTTSPRIPSPHRFSPSSATAIPQRDVRRQSPSRVASFCKCAVASRMCFASYSHISDSTHTHSHTHWRLAKHPQWVVEGLQ